MNFASHLTRPGSLLLAFALSIPTSAFCASARDDSKVFKVPPSQVNSSPYLYAGKIKTKLGGDKKVASGSIVYPGIVLTAADVTWTPETGFATEVVFERGRDLGKVLGTKKATFIILAKRFTTSTDSFAKLYTNIAGLLFKTPPLGGESPRVKAASTKAITSDFGHFILGYNARISNGNQMLDSFAQLEQEGGLLYVLAPRSQSTGSSFPGVSSVPAATKGGPFYMEEQVGFQNSAALVGVVVSGNFVRAFSQREIDLFTGGNSSSSTAQ